MKIAKSVKSKVAGFSLTMMIVSMFTVGVAQAATFTDVQPTDWFYSYVEQLAADGIINTTFTEYRPNDFVQRDEMAKLAVEAFKLPLENPATPTFKDVPKTAWSYQYVETAYKNGVIGGYKDASGTITGYYGPGDFLTREQAMKIIVNAAPLTTNTKGGPHFSDVPVSAWSYEYVETGYNWSVVDGIGDGSFAPAKNVRRNEVAKMVANGMNPVARPGSGFTVDTATATSATMVDVCYNEAPKASEATTLANYAVATLDGTALAVSASVAAVDPMCVTLTTAAQDSAKVYEVTVSNVTSDASAEALILNGNTAQFNGFSVGNVGGLTVRVDGSTPDTSYIPQNGANILYSVFALDASSDEDVRVEQLVVTRQGLGLPGDFKNVKLYVDGVQLGGEKTVNASTNTATFNLASTPIIVKAGTTSLVEVRGDMNGAVNSQNKFCVLATGDVTAFGQTTDLAVPVTASVPLCGNYMNTTSATVGTLTYTVSQTPTADINVGDKDVVMTKVRLDAATEDAVLDKITFKQTGSANNDTDFANARLVVSGTALAVTPTINGDYLTFDLTGLATPFLIAKGSSKNMELWVDVVGGLKSTAAFDIYRDWHIEGTGQVYHYGVNVVEGASGVVTARAIVGGNIAFALSSANPIAGDVAPGANDHEFLRFNVSTAGETVTVRKLTLEVIGGAGATAAEIEDLKIWTKNGAGVLTVVAGPNDVAALATPMAFTDSFDVPGGKTTEYIVTADIVKATVPTHTFAVNIDSVNVAAKTEMEYTSTGDPVNVVTEVSGGALTGNLQTAAAPSVGVTRASSPGDNTFVKNTTDRDLAAFDFAATTADDIKLTALTVSCTANILKYNTQTGNFNPALSPLTGGTSIATATIVSDVDNGTTGVLTLSGVGGTPPFVTGEFITDTGAGSATASHNLDAGAKCSDTFQSLYLYEKSGSTLTKLDGPRSMSSSAENGTITFSFTKTITAGNTTHLLVRGNIASAAKAGGYNFTTTAADVTAEDSQGSTANVTGGTTAARIVVVAGNGTIADTSASTVGSRILVGLSTAQPVLKLKFSADNLESWYIRKVQIDNSAGPAGDSDITGVHLTYNDGTSTYTADANMIGGQANFNLSSGHYIYVPANGNTTVDVNVDVNDVASGGATAGNLDTFSLNGAGTFQAVGASSGTAITTATSVTGQEMRVARSAPTVAKSTSSLSTTLANTSSSLYKWTVSADAANDIAIKQMALNVSLGGATKVDSLRLFRTGPGGSSEVMDTEAHIMAQGGLQDLRGSGPFVPVNPVLIQWNAGGGIGEDTIGKGTTVTYELKANITGSVNGDSVSTYLLYDTATVFGLLTNGATEWQVDSTDSDFIWSDLSVSPHNSTIAGPSSLDWLDGYLVNGLISPDTFSMSR